MQQTAIINQSTQTLIENLLTNDPRLVSHHTTRQYKADLFDFESWRNGRLITKTLVEEYAAQLQAGGYAPNTINQRLAAIRWYARKVVDLVTDYGDSDPETIKHASRVSQVKDVKGERPERGRHIEQGELYALMQACTSDPSPTGTRDAALVALAWSTGLRRDEISQIQFSDISQQADGLDIAIMGKGRKPRTVYLNNGALFALLDWLQLRGDAGERVFCEVNKGGNVIASGSLSGEALRKMLKKRSTQAKLSKPITWHDFRRTFSGNLYGAGIDGATIQKLMGHASQNQTAKYDRRQEETRRQAVKVLHVPYTRKEREP